MEKTLYVLREISWGYNDEWYYPTNNIRNIYKKYTHIEDAKRDKQRLEIYDIKMRPILDTTLLSSLSKDLQNKFYLFLKEHFSTDIEQIMKFVGFEHQCQIQSNILHYFIDQIIWDDRLILKTLEILDLHFYEIIELKESENVYRISPNPNFKSYDVFDEWVLIEFFQSSYVYTQKEAWETAIHNFYETLLSPFKLIGSLSELSEVPEILKSYLENYPCFIHENHLLSIKKIESKEALIEIMTGLVALLRPEKIPFIIDSISVTQSKEYFSEKNKKIQEYKQKFMDSLPF
jgi:hypothetical protein